MKLNLECGNDFRSGYVNITSNPQIPENLPENLVVVPGHFTNLDPIITEPVEEIVFNPFLNILVPNDIPQILGYWKSKLRKNGILKITKRSILSPGTEKLSLIFKTISGLRL